MEETQRKIEQNRRENASRIAANKSRRLEEERLLAKEIEEEKELRYSLSFLSDSIPSSRLTLSERRSGGRLRNSLRHVEPFF
jgi:hypothetical protein